jgi:putative transcriptional regulator
MVNGILEQVRGKLTPAEFTALQAELRRAEEPRFDFEPVRRLSRDIRDASVTLSADEARFLVDQYYIMQEDRKRGRAQERALDTSNEPHTVISWLADQSSTLEKQIVGALDAYTYAHPIGDWLRGTYGVGPVLAAGLLAHIYMGYWCAHCHGRDADDCARRQANKKLKLEPHAFEPIESCPVTGHFWSYAGIAGDNQRKWLPKTKRPWNATLKTILWRLSDVFVKFSNNDRCFYGRIYRERKEYEVARNERGGNKQAADERLARDVQRKQKSVENEPYHAKGMLSPGHLDLRARRYAVKLFLAHLHDEWYRRTFDKAPPLPYPIAHLNHVHFVPAPPRTGPAAEDQEQPAAWKDSAVPDERLREMTEAEVEAAAARDPDARPMTPAELAAARPVARVKTLRRALGLTQQEFAERYQVPLGTLRDWEQGRTEPDQPARAYLMAIAHDPEGARPPAVKKDRTDGEERAVKAEGTDRQERPAQPGISNSTGASERVNVGRWRDLKGRRKR